MVVAVVIEGVVRMAVPIKASDVALVSSVLKSTMRILMWRLPPRMPSTCLRMSSSSSILCPMLLGRWVLTI